MDEKQRMEVGLPDDAVIASKLSIVFPEYKSSYVRHLLRQTGAPIISQYGAKFVSVSAFKEWYDNKYNGHYSDRYIAQERRVRSFLMSHTCTRSELEEILKIRIPNICRIVRKLDKSPTHQIEVVRVGCCPITGHKAEFIKLVRKDEVR